jgi:phosphate transport system substrate-binding protein
MEMKNNILWQRPRCIIIWIVLSIGLLGCGDRERGAPASLPTRGDLVVGIDESLRPFAEAEIGMFSVYYPDARLTPMYLPEKRVLENLLANEIQTAIICRDLYPEESDHIAAAHGHSVRSFKLADDAIVAVVNKENSVSAISLEDMKGVLSGTVSNWGQLSIAADNPMPILVILTRSSSIDRYFSFAGPISTNFAYAFDTTTEVIDYVRDNIPAMGIVGGSWFHQKGDKYSDVRVLTFKAAENGAETKTPYREVYAVTHEPNTGLGSGFISFMAGQKGQLILSKAGMLPYKPILREVSVSDSF